MRAVVLAALLASALGCELDERNDFLIGRECLGPTECDPGDSCLPHAWLKEPSDRRCRSEISFQRTIDNREPPLAFCREAAPEGVELFVCPEGTVCRADRVRNLDGAVRREVCQLPDSPFGPPP